MTFDFFFFSSVVYFCNYANDQGDGHFGKKKEFILYLFYYKGLAL
jgi:hypothetical protein